MSPRALERNFRIVALAEATSFLALLVATVVKHAADQSAGVEILGPLHGALFVLYGLLAIWLWPQAGWSARTGILVLLGAVVPFGGYVVDRRLPRMAHGSTAG